MYKIDEQGTWYHTNSSTFLSHWQNHWSHDVRQYIEKTSGSDVSNNTRGHAVTIPAIWCTVCQASHLVWKVISQTIGLMFMIQKPHKIRFAIDVHWPGHLHQVTTRGPERAWKDHKNCVQHISENSGPIGISIIKIRRSHGGLIL